ncbi:MAG: hypothetical protein QXS38_01625 [Candidatus Pacearchaeota archaeon]
MKKIILTFSAIIIFIALTSTASASVYNLEISQIDDKLLIKHKISFDYETSISFSLPSDASSISAKQNYALDSNILTTNGKNIEISYLTKEALQKSENAYYFVDKILFNSNFTEAYIRLILDEGYYTDKDKIYPEPNQITTDGRQIILEWIVANAKKGDDFPIFTIIQTKSSTSNTIIWLIVIPIILFVLYLLYAKYLRKSMPKTKKKTRKPKEKPKTKFEDVERYLVESEKAVLNELKKSDRGEAWQKQLQIATGYSKAKLSRVIRNLEARNLVEKIPFGNTNKVRLR